MDLRLNFNKAVAELCESDTLDQRSRDILKQVLVEGYSLKEVAEFIGFARSHPKLTFLVTRVGCGIAGVTDDEIAPLFENAHDAENIVLPAGW